MVGARHRRSKSQNGKPTTIAPQPRAHILVIDNDFGPRESLRAILNRYYHVHVAGGGAQALNVVRCSPVDLIILSMPGMSGIEVLDRVKQYDPSIEALMIIASVPLDAALEGLRLGAFDYVTNPFDVNTVLSLVEHGLRRRSTAELFNPAGAFPQRRRRDRQTVEFNTENLAHRTDYSSARRSRRLEPLE